MILKVLIKYGTVKFVSFQNGFFTYNIEYSKWKGLKDGILYDSLPQPEVISQGYCSERETYQFTIPIEDIGKGKMLAEDKAIFYMRWVRKAIEENTLIKIN